ncbi:sigma-70 family RNA polymerase sigma factor [Actinoplanes sp. NPDC004185]
MLSSDHDDQCDLDAAARAYAEDRTRAGPAGRRALRDDLIRRCLPLAGRLARRHQDRPEPLDDLEQVARLGLIKAVDQYDPARGSFTAFAVITVCGELKRHLPARTRVPATAGAAEPPGARARTLADLLGGSDETMDELPDRLAVTELVRMLPHRIQRIIAWRFHGNQSQARIAEQLGISQMQVSRLLQQALTWLRTAMLSDVPPPWTGQDDTHGPDSLRIDIRHGDTALMVRVRGEIDRDTADRLRHRLHAAVSLATPGPLVVDLTGVPLVDAAGAAVLRDAFMAGALSGVEVTFTGLQPHVATVLTVLGLTRTGNAGAPAEPR